jgi:hypothetical protein
MVSAQWQPYFARSSSLVTKPQPFSTLKFLAFFHEIYLIFIDL